MKLPSGLRASSDQLQISRELLSELSGLPDRYAWPINQLDWHFVADRAVCSLLIVVSTPSLAFSSGVVEGHEPMRV
jgi:hypothetical protein